MGEPITGTWGRIYTAPYAGSAKWGTGVNPIHSFYGEDGGPLRVRGRNDDMPEISAPGEASPSFVELAAPWGYQPEDLAGLDVFASPEEAVEGVEFIPDDRPVWGVPTTASRATVNNDSYRPWNSTGWYKNILRSIVTGPGNINTVGKFSYQIPMETVNEGWINKPASGMDEGEVADAEVSDPSQYIVQTSMVQRYKNQNNQRSQLRGTDDDRTAIESRVAPMKLKIYSEGQRHYDMFPYQLDDMPRPFWYRRAGTGRVPDMAPNAMVVISPIQRTVPPDPSLGPEDTSFEQGDGFGYTAEDQGWY